MAISLRVKMGTLARLINFHDRVAAVRRLHAIGEDVRAHTVHQNTMNDVQRMRGELNAYGPNLPAEHRRLYMHEIIGRSRASMNYKPGEHLQLAGIGPLRPLKTTAKGKKAKK